MSNIKYENNRVYADISLMKEVAKASGLRCKKIRKIKKRFKKALNMILKYELEKINE